MLPLRGGFAWVPCWRRQSHAGRLLAALPPPACQRPQHLAHEPTPLWRCQRSQRAPAGPICTLCSLHQVCFCEVAVC